MKKEFSPILNRAGLNLRAVFDIKALPQHIQSLVKPLNHRSYPQLIIFAHAGKKMWKALQDSPFQSVADPIDSFSCHTVKQYFAQEHPNVDYQIIYPSNKHILPLQQLGAFASWHHDSPFRIGINIDYGTWFAYRVAVLANTCLEPTQPMTSPSPCDSCTGKPCIKVCPAGALTRGDLSLETCINYRLEEQTKCKTTCLSRISCPIAKEHQYSQDQIKYHYGHSLHTVLESQTPSEGE